MPTISIKKPLAQNRTALANKIAKAKRQHDNDRLDEALRETFPASDPVAISVTHISIARK